MFSNAAEHSLAEHGARRSGCPSLMFGSKSASFFLFLATVFLLLCPAHSSAQLPPSRDNNGDERAQPSSLSSPGGEGRGEEAVSSTTPNFIQPRPQRSPAQSPARENDSYYARVWLAEDGLPENKVVGAAQTSDGYLWVATQGGVVRFDGVRFQSFEAVNGAGLGTSTMLSLLLDRQGRLWLAKDRGVVVCLEGTQMRAFTPKDGLPDFQAQRSMADDAEGNLWIAYTRGAVVRLAKDGQITTFSPADGLPAGGSCTLAADRNGRLWFAKNGRFGTFRNGRFTTLQKLPSADVRLAPARFGGIWICAGQQLFKYTEGQELTSVGEVPATAQGAEPTVLLEDRWGALWVGTASAGLYRSEGTAVTKVNTSHSAILSLAEDLEGNLWVGTRGGGLNRLQRRVASLIGTAAGLPFESVQSVCQETNGTLWAVGQNGMLARQEQGNWSLISAVGGTPGRHATCVAAHPDGGIWVGTQEGALYRWQEGQFTRPVLHGSSFNGQSIWSLFATRAGDLWLGTDSASALFRLRGDSVQKFAPPPGHRRLRAMTEDAAGNFWAGASDGLLLCVTNDLLTIEAKASPLSIRGLLGTADGSLWIAYAGFGIARLRDGQLRRFGQEQGLPNNYVSQILSDEAGSLWFAGNQGLFSVREKEFEEVASGRALRLQPALYGRSEGLPNLQANLDFCPNALRAADGRLFFSMLTGLAEVRPGRAGPNHLPPRLCIEKVVADGKTVAAYQISDPSAAAAEPAPSELKDRTVELRLPPGVQQLHIEFAALSFVAPENVRFRYQLEGLDQDWTDAGTRRAADYTHLPPGQFLFKVSACNNEGIWNTMGAALALTVLPHFWQTLWFTVAAPLLLGALLLGSVVLLLRRRHRLQIQRLEHQRSLERERTRIAQDLHDDLGVGLTEIGLLGDLAGAPATRPEASRDCVRQITERARSLAGLLDEIVWAINPANDTSQSVTDYLSRYAQTLLQRASIRCRLEVAESLPSVDLNAEQRHQLFLAFKEALNNIVRHSGATEVLVSLAVSGNQWLIRLADNGRGLQAPSGEGSHDGLTSMRERLKRLGGSCNITSAAGAGTTVTFFVPFSTDRTP